MFASYAALAIPPFNQSSCSSADKEHRKIAYCDSSVARAKTASCAACLTATKESFFGCEVRGVTFYLSIR